MDGNAPLARNPGTGVGELDLSRTIVGPLRETSGEDCEGDGSRDSGGVPVCGGDGNGSWDSGGVPVCERGLDASACVSGLVGGLGEALIWVLIKRPHAFLTTFNRR